MNSDKMNHPFMQHSLCPFTFLATPRISTSDSGCYRSAVT